MDGIMQRRAILTVFLLLLGFQAPADSLARLGLPVIPLTFRDVSPKRVELGRKLFFDPRLSADGTVSCASCHRPEHDFTDGRPHGVGVSGQTGTRNVPSLYNVVFATSLFWDGRATDLESQATLPLLNTREHGLSSEEQLLSALETSPAYRKLFHHQDSEKRITINAVAVALAAYERTLISADSPFDRYYYGGDEHAMSDSAVRGLSFFLGRGGCATCHTIGKTSALLTDQEFHSSPKDLPKSVSAALVELTARVNQMQEGGSQTGLNSVILGDSDIASLGRYNVTRNPKDIGLFKTPSLRNVAKTAPYLHDGQVQTLEEVVDLELYSRSDVVRAPIVATVQEREDLVNFLVALSSERTN